MASRLRRQVDNLRAALDWALSRRGDVVLGIALTIASIPFWMYLSLVEECRRHVDRALVALAKNGGGDEYRDDDQDSRERFVRHHGVRAVHDGVAKFVFLQVFTVNMFRQVGTLASLQTKIIA